MLKFHRDGICGFQITQLSKDAGPWCYEFNEIHNTVLFADLDSQRSGKKKTVKSYEMLPPLRMSPLVTSSSFPTTTQKSKNFNQPTIV